MTAETPDQWTVDSSRLSDVGKTIWDKLVVAVPLWGSDDPEDLKGGADYNIGGGSWVDDATYGKAVSRVRTDSNGYITSFNPPAAGFFFALFYRERDDATEIWVANTEAKFNILSPNNSGIISRFGHTTNDVLGTHTVDTWARHLHQWNATDDDTELFVNNVSQDSKTSGISDPGASGTTVIGKANPNGWEGKIACFCIGSTELTSAERTAIDADPWVWCRPQKLVAAISVPVTTAPGLKGRGVLASSIAADAAIAAGIFGRGQIAAAVPVSATLSPALQGRGGMDALIPVSATLAPAIAARGTLSGAIALTATVSPDLNARGRLDALLPVSALVSPALSGQGSVAAALPVVAAVSPTIFARGGLGALISPSLTVGPTLSASGSLDAAVSATAMISGEFAVTNSIAASLQTDLTIAAGLSAVGKLEASQNISTSVAAGLVATGTLAASVATSTSFAAGLNARGTLSATIPGVVSIAANLSNNRITSNFAVTTGLAANLTQALGVVDPYTGATRHITAFWA